MELKEFIKATLVDIKEGVEDANKELQTPFFRLIANNNKNTSIEFDVAVTVEAKSTKSGSGKISVWKVGIGGSKENTNSDVTVSRIKFKVDSLLIK